MNRIVAWLSFVLALSSSALALAQTAIPPGTAEIRAAELEDKIRGGMLGQILGNLNGLPHEFKYIDEPGNVEHYTPSLPNGAVTDDDTDIEWVYLRAIVHNRENMLPPERITALWKEHINRRIFCANMYARGLMNLGFEPPWTGNVALNPWSDFNISGQFLCESFGLMAPGMPQTAARLGLHYTHVGIDGEPAQATQLFTTMIATAYFENDINRILDAGQKAIYPKSKIAGVVTETRDLCRANPNDWRATRLELKNRWQKYGGEMRDRNGYELNTASTVAALVYGHGDFVETLRHAFNFGWDADNNAATSATIVGVIHGRRWMNEQGWDIKDVYRNTTRDNMPNDETLTSLEQLVINAARSTVQKNGGSVPPSPSGRGQVEGEPGQSSANSAASNVYQIRMQPPANIEPLVTNDELRIRARKQFAVDIKRDLTAGGLASARAAYLAICFDEVESLKKKSPDAFTAAAKELEKHTAVVQNLFNSPAPTGDHLRRNAIAAGLITPPKPKR
jgi:hypothetical protein